MAAPPEVSTANLTGKFVMNRTLSDAIDPLLTLQGLSWFLRKAIKLATVTLSVRQYESDSKEADGKAEVRPEAEGEGGVAVQQPTTTTTTTHIDITQTATGGISTTQENRVLDWVERGHEDRIFGRVVGRSRFSFFTQPDGRGFEMIGSGSDNGNDKDGSKEQQQQQQQQQVEFDEKFLTAQVLMDGVTPSAWDYDDEPAAGAGTSRRPRYIQSCVRNIDTSSSTGGWTAEQVWGFERLADGKRYHTRRVVVRRDTDGKPGKVERARLVYDYIG